ncbi:PWI domain-containing protein [Lophiostoma macrostomum CBS 122681]|uniref:PWI domain-containing protein n=1 Tax=Lophiostoma macrostomum CBS 122681 TaxID=1314788 RepID=A0A6A6TTR0_9PLEO|nr:PWI domain-containing protein [Lophiostoma macrostomum CBS 122681]
MASSVDEKALKKTKFPPEFNKKVDTEKVNMEIMLKWLSAKLPEYMGTEDDDIMINTCHNMIAVKFPDIKRLQIFLSATLNGKEGAFCKELWDLMLSAQDSEKGVPQQLVEAKKEELKQNQASKVAAKSRRRNEQAENEVVDRFRRAEQAPRDDRGPRGGGGGGGGRVQRFGGDSSRSGGSWGRDYRRDFGRGRRDSRSPSP